MTDPFARFDALAPAVYDTVKIILGEEREFLLILIHPSDGSIDLVGTLPAERTRELLENLAGSYPNAEKVIVAGEEPQTKQ